MGGFSHQHLPACVLLCVAPHPLTRRQHLDSACKAVLKDNVNLAAYFAWSFLDSFEWADGYNARYGIVHVDRASEGLERHPKLSAQWLSQHFFRCGFTELSWIRRNLPVIAYTN